MTHSVCSGLFSSVRTPGPCLLALIYPSSITDVSAVINELRRAGGEGLGTWLEVAWDHMVGSWWVSVIVCVCVCIHWANIKLPKTCGDGAYRRKGEGKV